VRPAASDHDDEEERQHHILWSVFRRHDADDSGSIEMDEVRVILADYGIVGDEEKLTNTFKKYDIDNSWSLEFEEFTLLMNDLDATNQIVQKRTTTYELPAHMKNWFPQSKLDEFLVHFGMFDDNGDGTVDVNELREVLRVLGADMPVDQVQEIVEMIDHDRSGVVEYSEFISLMRKIETGEIDVAGR
jgi:calmodulin